MTDVVVTVPMWFWEEWIAEGDAVDDPYSGEEWHYYLSNAMPLPDIQPGERVYVVAHGKLRGYAPLVRVETWPRKALVRHGGAVAVTIEKDIRGFRGWRYRDWNREDEVAFPDWRIVMPRLTAQ